MRFCLRCQNIKEDNEFTPAQTRCRPCRAEEARFDRIFKRTGKRPLARHLAAPFHAIKKLVSKYDATAPLAIPVRAIGNPVPAPNACVLRPGNGRSLYHIASSRGQRTLQFEMTGPLDLIRNLNDLGLEVITNG